VDDVLAWQAMFGQEPPLNLRSTTATRFPLPTKAHSARVEPVPSGELKNKFIRLRILPFLSG
jgi:hypothetical protein